MISDSPSLKLTKEDFLNRDFIIQLGQEPVRIDISNDLNGVPFEQAWKNKKSNIFLEVLQLILLVTLIY